MNKSIGFMSVMKNIAHPSQTTISTNPHIAAMFDCIDNNVNAADSNIKVATIM